MSARAQLQVPSPLVGEGQGEGVAARGTLSCVLSPQGREEKKKAPQSIAWRA